MFSDIGKKIKTLATVICWIGISLSVIAMLVLIGIGVKARHGEITIGIGIGVGLVGSLLSWIGSFFIYGYGELIDKMAATEANTRETMQMTRYMLSRNDPSTDPAAERMAKLNTLHSQGVISDAEYNNAINNGGRKI